MAYISPLNMGFLHFVGIGGIGMSGIAEVLHNLGYTIQGTDIIDNTNIQRLRTLGIPIIIGHAAENLGKATVVIASAAIQDNNPEIIAARERLIPVLQRAEMLAELMRLNKYSIAVAGTHGKTTTTSMVAMLLDTAGFDPTVINGGIINAYGTNARLGSGEWMVVEADESDGTFTKLPTTIAIVTNIDQEHLDFWGDIDKVEEAFYTFVQNIPVYGLAILCLDHPRVQSLIPRISERRIITYGLSPQADVRAFNVRLSTRGTVFDVLLVDRKKDLYRVLPNINLPMYGTHNIQNSLATVAIALQLNIVDSIITHTLGNFSGVKRRFTCTGVTNGITVIDDYGHHPVEISAVLKAARDICDGRIIVVVQPHRYSRLRNLFESFCTCLNNADIVIVTDVYSAGEVPLEGVQRDVLVSALRSHGHRHVVTLPHSLVPEYTLARLIYPLAEPGDYIICMGAGNITQWANTLPLLLNRMYLEGVT